MVKLHWIFQKAKYAMQWKIQNLMPKQLVSLKYHLLLIKSMLECMRIETPEKHCMNFTKINLELEYQKMFAKPTKVYIQLTIS
ncbi:MAG: hypothetical protein EBR82_62575 [Caulobacteraceae bacterium]|nr:hypothetical protein [Caulobacteraceae bacterium]